MLSVRVQPLLISHGISIAYGFFPYITRYPTEGKENCSRFNPFVTIVTIREWEADWIEAERVAIQVAKEAGAMARKRFGSRFVVEEKGNSGDLVTEVDEAADRLIVDRIRNGFPHSDQRAFWLDWIRQVRKGSGTGV
jgi:hypothetical protein